MKAKDLMIGDWVNYHDDDKIVPKQVSEITNYKQLQLNDKNNWIIVGEKYCEPIPLTADIRDMVSCHPKMAIYWDDRKTEQTGEDWYEVRIHNGDESVLTLNLRYVHELQHALRLCGIEIEIEL